MPDILLDTELGIPSSILSQIDTTSSDVLSGKKFLSSNGTINTGSYSVTNKIQVLDIYHGPRGNEYDKGTSSVRASSTIKWCLTGTVCNTPNDPYNNYINITSVAGNTITYNWATHGAGVHCKLAVILE